MRKGLYSERIARRRMVWWRPPRPGGERSLADAVHRLSERRRLLDRDDPAEAWRCCSNWQRILLDKRNAREFAARHGCELPELYWRGRPLRRAPLESVGDEFVVRPARGDSTAGVHVIVRGRELLERRPLSPSELRRPGSLRDHLGIVPETLLEERVRPRRRERTFPLEVKFHTFAGEVGLIQANDRPNEPANRLDVATSFYSPEWEPHTEEMDRRDGVPATLECPPELERMLELASRIGGEIGTYMRIDFMDSDRGPVFQEVSSTPWLAVKATPFADELLGALWERHCPDGV